MRVTYLPRNAHRLIFEMGIEMTPANDWTVDVLAPDHALELLTYPDKTFGVADDEPLRQIVQDPQQLLGLAGAGVLTVGALAAASDAVIEQLAAEIGVTLDEVRGWVQQAKAMPPAVTNSQEAN